MTNSLSGKLIRATEAPAISLQDRKNLELENQFLGWPAPSSYHINDEDYCWSLI
jgi:hypothetical protein